MDRLTKCAAVLLGCSFASMAGAEAPYDRSYFALDAFAVQHDERGGADTELGFGGRGALGFAIGRSASTRNALEVGLFANPMRFEDGPSPEQQGIMFDLIHAWDAGRYRPYLLAGLGLVSESLGEEEGAYLGIEAGGGVAFSAFKDSFLRIGLSAMSVHNDDIDPAEDSHVDLRFNIGLLFPIAQAAAVAAAPARTVDSDGDGLADTQDKCPTTPASTADGCPALAPVVQTDTDGDGVYDAQDTCAGTLPGLKVDAAGCAVQTEAQSVVLKGVTFLPGSATLTEEAKGVLDTAATSLTADKSLKVELGGYTDSQGKDSSNLALSQKRADSVRQYLIGKGVEGERLTAKGYGEASPIADNDTVEGRAENRRVEIKVVK